MRWKHRSGGCDVDSRDDHPCKDQYEDLETGERITLRTTAEAHFRMPFTAWTLVELLERDGVKKPWKAMADDE